MGYKTALSYIMAATSFACTPKLIDKDGVKSGIRHVADGYYATQPGVEQPSISSLKGKAFDAPGLKFYYMKPDTEETLEIKAYDDDLNAKLDLKNISYYRYTRIDPATCYQHIHIYDARQQACDKHVSDQFGDSLYMTDKVRGGLDGRNAEVLSRFLEIPPKMQFDRIVLGF